jgi:hypothetical protein
MAWLPEALKYIGSGAIGALVSWGLSWLRERRRTIDAYRAPQRQAIGEIITATHALMKSELDRRLAMNELVKVMRQEQENVVVLSEELRAATVAMGSAMLDVERAFRIGSLTIIDAPCWEAMGAAYLEFDLLRAVQVSAAAVEWHRVEEIEQYVGVVEGHAKRFNKAVSALMPAANNRVSPADTHWNRWRRRRARVRLGHVYRQLHGVDSTDCPAGFIAIGWTS